MDSVSFIAHFQLTKSCARYRSNRPDLTYVYSSGNSSTKTYFAYTWSFFVVLGQTALISLISPEIVAVVPGAPVPLCVSLI